MTDIDPNEPTTTEEIIGKLDAELGENSDDGIPEPIEEDTTAVDPTPVDPAPVESSPIPPPPAVEPDPEPPAVLQPGDAELVGAVKEAEEAVDFMVECDVRFLLFDFVDKMAVAYNFTGKQHKRARDLAEEMARSLVLLGG